jgi:hypothetical protein
MQPFAMAAAAVLVLATAAQSAAPRELAIGTFVGTTPNSAILRAMGAPGDEKAEIVEWALTLYHDPETRAPTRYELRCAYGLTQPNHPGLARDIVRCGANGTWTRSPSTLPTATDVITLRRGLSLARFGDSVLHFLNSDRTLMTGNGGWNYTLTRAAAAERVDDASAPASSVSYTILPVATGPNVFGVFEGRTPCQGIMRELQRPADAGCQKAKWRVTLFQDPATRAPTTFRAEGTIFRAAMLEGRWRLADAAPAFPRARVFRLTADGATLSLFEADPNVVFFLDRAGQLMPGRADFGYTLERRR